MIRRDVGWAKAEPYPSRVARDFMAGRWEGKALAAVWDGTRIAPVL